MPDPKVRILINTDSGFAEIMVPRRLVIMSLLNEAIDKTFLVEEAWANGDGVEVTLRRVPARSP